MSNRLAACDYDALEEMVTPYVFSQIKKHLPYFTENQRQKLSLAIEDIAVSFIDDIQITDSEYSNRPVVLTYSTKSVSYTHLTLPTIYSV